MRFVNVTWDLFWDPVKLDYYAWDTHTKNFPILKDNKLPGLDKTYSTLMEVLDARGLLDETLVVVMSKMGARRASTARTLPRGINIPISFRSSRSLACFANAKSGRMDRYR